MALRTLSKITKITFFPLWQLLFTGMPLKGAEPCGDKSMFCQPRILQLKLLVDITSGDTDQGGRIPRRQAYVSWGC